MSMRATRGLWGWLLGERKADHQGAFTGRRHAVPGSKTRLDRLGKISIGNSDFVELSEQDLVETLFGNGGTTKFLGQLSKEDVEPLLDGVGFLDELRARGFANLEVRVDFGHPLGQDLRIFDRSAPAGLLVEMRVDRSTGAVPGMTTLQLEWILLQNPRREFRDPRLVLPGQQHPGLGLMPEVLALLLGLCEKIRLDGVYLRPSYFHVASKVWPVGRFLEAGAEARFRAQQKVLGALELAEASHAFGQNRVVDSVLGRPVCWQPSAMVVPASERMRTLVGSAEFERTVERELAGLEFSLATASE